MKQQVELKEDADAFKSLNLEVFVVFREESEEVERLKKLSGSTTLLICLLMTARRGRAKSTGQNG